MQKFRLFRARSDVWAPRLRAAPAGRAGPGLVHRRALSAPAQSRIQDEPPGIAATVAQTGSVPYRRLDEPGFSLPNQKQPADPRLWRPWPWRRLLAELQAGGLQVKYQHLCISTCAAAPDCGVADGLR